MSHSTMEPLLRDSEKEAVSAILKFLDSGGVHITIPVLYKLPVNDNTVYILAWFGCSSNHYSLKDYQ